MLDKNLMVLERFMHGSGPMSGLARQSRRRSDLMKLLVDVGLNTERKGLLTETMRRSGIEVFFVDEATPDQKNECEALLQSFGDQRRIADNVASARKLRMMQTISAGVDRVPFDSIPPEVTVCSNAGAFSAPIAEHTFAMVLGLAKRLKLNELKMISGQFDQETRTVELRGKVLGVLGYGGIGKAVAAVGRCLGMKVYGISRNESDAATCDYHGDLGKLDDMLSKSDAVVVAIPLNRETNGLIGKQKLSLMKHDAILVNVARAHIIVERDLYEHLKENPSFYAGIDAWWHEPRRDQKFSGNLDFMSLPNVIGSPHNSGIVEGMSDYVVSRAFENIVRFASGKTPHNIVRREDYINRTG